MPRLPAPGPVLLAVATAAAGCTRAIDTRDTEAKVEQLAEATVAPVARVTCPNADRREGVRFDCAVTFEDGGTHALRIVQIDDHGNYTPAWVEPIASLERVATLLASELRDSAGGDPRVDCGRGVKVVPADGLPCELTAGELRRGLVFRFEADELVWELRP
jgi:hypothetical protein